MAVITVTVTVNQILDNYSTKAMSVAAYNHHNRRSKSCSHSHNHILSVWQPQIRHKVNVETWWQLRENWSSCSGHFNMTSTCGCAGSAWVTGFHILVVSVSSVMGRGEGLELAYVLVCAAGLLSFSFSIGHLTFLHHWHYFSSSSQFICLYQFPHHPLFFFSLSFNFLAPSSFV